MARAECGKFGFSGGCVWVLGPRCCGMVLVVFRDVGLKRWIGHESQELIALRGESSEREGSKLGHVSWKGDDWLLSMAGSLS